MSLMSLRELTDVLAALVCYDFLLSFMLTACDGCIESDSKSLSSRKRINYFRRSKKILGTFSNDDENVNVTDRKLVIRTSMLPRMPNRARLVVHSSFRTPFGAICRLVVNVSTLYLFSNFYLRTLGISLI